MYNIGDKVRVLRVPGRPDIKPFKTEVTSIGFCCFGYGVKDISGQDSVFDEWGVNESDLEPIERKTMKDTITIEEYNRIIGFKGPFIPTVWVEYMTKYGSMNMNHPVPIDKLWPFISNFPKKMLTDAGYSPAPEHIDWSKVEFGTKIRVKNYNRILRFLKFDMYGFIIFWDEKDENVHSSNTEDTILAE